MTASPNESMGRSHWKTNGQMVDEKEIETDLPGTIVSHGVVGMAAVKDPAKVLGELV